MGDFNIDLLKVDINDESNAFYNNVTSHFFTPFILQHTRLKSKTLIDNIFINSVEYPSYSGNLTIQLSDHLFQFVIFERNFKNFSEQEFNDKMKNTKWKYILRMDLNDPNLSVNNLHGYINKLIDMYAPYKKHSKKEIKLKSKPWINNEIISLMKKGGKLLFKYTKHKKNNSELATNLYNEYKIIRNNVTTLKRDSKLQYYKKFFDLNKNKMSTKINC